MGCQRDQRSSIDGSRINNSLGGTSRLDPALHCAGGKIVPNKLKILVEFSDRIINHCVNHRHFVRAQMIRHVNYIDNA